METLQRTQTEKNKFNGDSIGSMFYWKPFFITGYEYTYYYSKEYGKPESIDPERRLCTIVADQYTKGFIHKCKYVEIYARAGEIIKKDTDPLIGILKPKAYNFLGSYLEQNPFLKKMLIQLFECIENGTPLPPREMLIPPAKKIQRDFNDVFNAEKQAYYRTFSQFFERMIYLKDSLKLPIGQLTAIYIAQQEKHPSLFLATGIDKRMQDFIGSAEKRKLITVDEYNQRKGSTNVLSNFIKTA